MVRMVYCWVRGDCLGISDNFMKEDKIVFFRQLSDTIQMLIGAEKMFDNLFLNGDVRLREEEVESVSNAIKELQEIVVKVEATRVKFEKIVK